MLATYLSVIAVCTASLAIGQAALAICGRGRWSWLAPATGLALVTTICWATVRLPGEGAIAAAAVLLVTVASVVFLRGRADGAGEALREGWPVALGALLAASLPFVVEGRFGILGTGFNPDMSQHLLAAEGLLNGDATQLLGEGYPLGPHAIVVALGDGLGVGLVQGFGGLTVAVAVLASLTALAALRELAPLNRWVAALLVGLSYLIASYIAQGAFKETMQALFVLAFAVCLAEMAPASGRLGRGDGPDGRAVAWLATGRAMSPPASGALVGVPLAILAAGSVFTYSFPGLTWLLGALGLWALAELVLVARAGGDVSAALRTAIRPAGLALIVFAVLAAPELGRMLEFARFETFDPNGPGLGNLFGQISPAEALGVWPSGDFRLTPGDGAVPAIAFYAGVAFAALLLAFGVSWWWRRAGPAIPAALAAAGLAYLAARLGGTPYTAAKAVAMAAPLAALTITRPLFDFNPAGIRSGGAGPLKPTAAAAFAVAAAGCSLLALANGPVGPAAYSSRLTALRPQLASSSTLVLAPREFLREEHGTRYLAWELRGGRVCIRAAGPPRGTPPPRGIRFVITPASAGSGPPFAGLGPARPAGPYLLWRRAGPAGGPSPCPLIAVRSARQGSQQGD